MKQLTFKEYLSLTEDQIFDLSLHYSKKDQQVASRVADSLFNIYAATEPVLEQVSLERLFQTEERNRFVSFCPVGYKGDSSGKVRLTSEFFRNPKTKQIVANQNRTGLYDIIKDLASWELKLKLAGVSKRVNLGLMPGWTDSSKTKYLFILDLDNKNSFKGNIQKIIESIGIKTFITSTPSGGAHLYFFSTKEESNSPLCNNADVRAKTYCLAPGSQTEKGFYTQDIENPLFQKEIATVPLNWREIFNERINEFLKPLTSSAVASNPSLPPLLPLLSIDVTASKSSETLKKKEGEKVGSNKKKTKGGSYRILKGERSMRLTAIAGGLVHSSSSIEDLFNKLIDIRNSRMEDPKSFLDSEVENIAKWVWKKEHSNPSFSPSPLLPLLSIDVTATKRSTEIENRGEQAYTKYEQELINILKTISKTKEFNGHMENIAPVIQKFFEKKFNKKYNNPILSKAVGKILIASGFSKVQRRINGQVTRVWNTPQTLITALTTSPEENNSSLSPLTPLLHTCNVGWHIGVHAEPQASMKDEQLNSEPVTKSSHSQTTSPEEQTGIESSKPECQPKPLRGSAKPATEIKEQTPMNKQEPVETALNNIQEQIIETLLEIQKATDITPTQRKQYFIEACEMINYSIWKDLPKYIQNIIPSDQIIKIIRRK